MHQIKQMNDCIEACSACHDECERTLFQHCLEKGGQHAERRHIALMSDCIEICQTAANFMLRGSDNAVAVCKACAEICAACADSCETLSGEEMKHCAAACRACAEACREMGGGPQGARGSKESGESLAGGGR